MDNYMMIVVVPSGYGDKVLETAHKAGAKGGTVIQARGAEAVEKESIFSIRIEPQEEVILIMGSKLITEVVSNKLNEEFKKNCKRGGAVYILPVHRIEDTVYPA